MSDETSSPSNAWLTVGAAFVIVVLAIGAYVYFNSKPPVHAGQILSVNVYPIHRELHAGRGAEGLQGQGDTYDETIVLADVRIANQADIPLFLHDMSAVVDLPDENQRSTDASQTDFEKVFVAYPELKPLRKDPVRRDITLQPGQQVEGMMIFNYQMTKAQWDSRTGLDIICEFLHQKPLVLHIGKQ